MAKCRLIIFVKAPRPGFVKTRLAKSIGDDAACSAYGTLAESLLENLAELNAVELRFAPDDAADELRPWRRKKWTLVPQGAGDLGERLQNAFASAHSDGCDRIAVIGSDCPDITANDIRGAWRELNEHDIVVGPAHDGGYWLIALREPHSELFSNIDWSTDRVLDQTLEIASASGLKVARLRTLTDIDTLDEWTRFVENRVQS